MKKLNLGSGKDIKHGFVNLDSVKMPGIDVVHNLNKFPYPFKESTFDFVYAAHILEHLDNLVKAMQELHRISKNNATIAIKVPFFPSMYAASDPTHKNFFTYLTWDYFTDPHHNHIFGDLKKPLFKMEERKIVFSWNKLLAPMNKLINLFPVFYQRYLAFILPSNELVVKLRVIK
ncbi:MAG: class I SAM-dependent methyltransferase [archaeon]|nr:class I SAM-dependent methyltransferase [archaeon]